MADPLAQWWRHTVQLRRVTGSGSKGDILEPEPGTPLLGFVSDKRQMVRAQSGDLVVSETSVMLPVAVGAVPLDSLVTLPAQFGPAVRRVIACSVHDGGGQPTPDHVELALA
jgi:hypothetical protein